MLVVYCTTSSALSGFAPEGIMLAMINSRVLGVPRRISNVPASNALFIDEAKDGTTILPEYCQYTVRADRASKHYHVMMQLTRHDGGD